MTAKVVTTLHDNDTVVIDGTTWSTPLTHVELRTVGGARLIRRVYRGTYHYEGTDGFEFYRVPQSKPLTVIGLQRRHGRRSWKTWMVDDPLHWNGMREAVAKLPAGHIVVAGLGLGLMLHHMTVQDRFSRITVVEWDPDVMDLMRDTLPLHDARIELVEDDFYHHIEGKRGLYDGVLWDLAVGQPERTQHTLLHGKILCWHHLGVLPVQFGLRQVPRSAALELLRELEREA